MTRVSRGMKSSHMSLMYSPESSSQALFAACFITSTLVLITAADLPLWRGKGEGVLGEDVVRDGEPDDKLDVLEGWLGTQQINK